MENNFVGRKLSFEEKYPNAIEIITFRSFLRQGRFNIDHLFLENKDLIINKGYILRIYEIPETISEDITEDMTSKKTTIGKRLSFEEKYPNAIEITSYISIVRPKGENQGYFNVKNSLIKNKYVEANMEYLLRTYGSQYKSDEKEANIKN